MHKLTNFVDVRTSIFDSQKMCYAIYGHIILIAGQSDLDLGHDTRLSKDALTDKV